MSEFYARYIPPSPVWSKPKVEPLFDVKRPEASIPQRQTKKRKIDHAEAGQDVLSKYKVTEIPNDPSAIKLRTKSTKHDRDVVNKELLAIGRSHKPLAKTTENEEIEVNGRMQEDDENGGTKHAKVLSRFAKSRETLAQSAPPTVGPNQRPSIGDVHPDRIKLHDLEPLPQPKTNPAEITVPSYATAPEWLRTPLKVDENDSRSFKALGLSEKLLYNLEKQGKRTALPVQTAVLPLLLNVPLAKRPDLCVAAATGSGKTFSYILPILEDLRDRPLTLLQAVIVVPTRALVKQVMQTLKLYSAGLDLRLGSAEGSKTLAEEQQQLIEESLVYDPTEYAKQQNAPIDWGKFSLSDLLDDVEKLGPLDDVGRVRQWNSRVNILVCTPGRLVEHLQSTRGFNLDHVQWFIVDEADRLLNESYNEWLDVVLRALKSQFATEKRDQVLRKFKMNVPERAVNKVLLSATMSADISRLLELELRNPKMVIVEDQTSKKNTDDTVASGADSNYHLPARLQETAIALKDSQNKPLYLLILLNNHILGDDQGNGQPITSRASLGNSLIRSAEDSSSDVSSSSNDDATSSLGSGTNSDSEDESKSISSDSDSSVSSSSSSHLPSDDAEAPKKTSKFPRKTCPRILIFTKSTESAHRLSRLLSLLHPELAPLISTFTRSSVASDQNPNDTHKKENTKPVNRSRTKILNSFANGQTRILISTDLAGRGLDIPHLAHVINYDIPTSAMTYVHRVGRTARAGEDGQAWSLIEHRQGKWFWETIGGKSSGQSMTNVVNRGDRVVRKLNLTIDKEKWTDKYEDALRKLGEDVRGQ